jgi:NAD(P)-dependent dehydrogenase (short-subunit alcohol dehydrogenase family)
MSHIVGKNVLIVGGGSGLGYHLSKRFFKSKKVITYFKTRPNDNNSTIHKLNLEKEKELICFNQFLLNLGLIFDIVYFIGAHTPHYELNEKNSTFSGSYSQKTLDRFIKINCFAPMFIFQKLYQNQLIKKNAKILFFSSLAGSISNRGILKHNLKGGNQFYRVSKSALNSGVKNIAYDLDHTNLKLVTIHPGWVKTKSGGSLADFNISESIDSIIDFTNKINKSHHGGFYFLNGKRIEW